MFENLKKYPEPLRISILEGMMASIMSGGALIFIVPFAVFLGANSFEIGLLAALPALLGAWFQLGSLKLLEVYKKRKNAIVLIVFLQAISWLLIALIPFIFPSDQVLWLILITTIGTLVGSAGAPLWQSWMRSLTPENILGEYFGVRNAITGTVVFLTMLFCGILLDAVNPSLTLFAFCGIFIISFAGRIGSAALLTRIEDNGIIIDKTEKTNVFAFIKQLSKDNFGHFVLFGTLMTLAIAIVGPFFSLYLLEGLNLKKDYLLYTLIMSASTVTTLLSMPYWGRVIDKHGTIKVLKATGLLVCLYPIALILVREPIGLGVAELLCGVIFSGFNLCLANFIYESFKPEKIIKYASFQGALFGTATFVGIIVSGYVQTFDISFGFLSTTFYVVCAAAVILRLFFYTALVNKIKEVKETKPINESKLVMSVLTFEPIRQPLVTSVGLMILKTEDTLVKATRRTIMTANEIKRTSEEGVYGTIKFVDGVAKKEINNAKNIIKKRKKKGFL